MSEKHISYLEHKKNLLFSRKIINFLFNNISFVYELLAMVKNVGVHYWWKYKTGSVLKFLVYSCVDTSFNQIACPNNQIHDDRIDEVSVLKIINGTTDFIIC